MPRKKKLNAIGRSIMSFSVHVISVKSAHVDKNIDVIDLVIRTDDDFYKYEISKDVNEPDLYRTRDYIESSILKAQEDFLRIEISEDKEKTCLHFKVQKIGQTMYSGLRV